MVNLAMLDLALLCCKSFTLWMVSRRVLARRMVAVFGRLLSGLPGGLIAQHTADEARSAAAEMKY